MTTLATDGKAQHVLCELKETWPRWMPASLISYLAHTEHGLTIRAIARARTCHPSTILRQIGRWEQQRDDKLIDEALTGLMQTRHHAACDVRDEDFSKMIRTKSTASNLPEDSSFAKEACRVLRRLSEPHAVLALAADMEKGVVVRDTKSGTSLRTAIVDRSIAQALALKDWINCAAEGRVARYHITSSGRTALNRMLAEAENRASGFAEAASEFDMSGGNAVMPATTRKHRYGSGESPLMILARRREKDGTLFLSPEHVSAGERLREDYELAQMSDKPSPDWAEVIAGEGRDSAMCLAAQKPLSVEAAQARVKTALRHLGSGLGDITFRCCCLLEGVETAERALGWSARSGKVVLRIALTRLAQHYTSIGGGDMIG